MALSYVEVIQSERDFLMKVLESYPAEAKACRRAAARLAVRWAPPLHTPASPQTPHGTPQSTLHTPHKPHSTPYDPQSTPTTSL